jgi:hypothetical protein
VGVDRDERLSSLYSDLRAEILHADTQNYQVLAVTVAAAAALLTAGINQGNPAQRAVVFGLVYLVTWPCQRLLQGNRRRTWRISSYLRNVVEPQLDGVNWESDLSALNRTVGSQDRRRISTMVARNEWLIVTVLNASAGLCILGFAVFAARIPVWQQMTAVAAIVAANIALAVYANLQDRWLRRGERADALFDKLWQSTVVSAQVASPGTNRQGLEAIRQVD